MPLGAGATALQRITGKVLDVRPPRARASGERSDRLSRKKQWLKEIVSSVIGSATAIVIPNAMDLRRVALCVFGINPHHVIQREPPSFYVRAFVFEILWSKMREQVVILRAQPEKCREVVLRISSLVAQVGGPALLIKGFQRRIRYESTAGYASQRPPLNPRDARQSAVHSTRGSQDDSRSPQGACLPERPGPVRRLVESVPEARIVPSFH